MADDHEERFCQHASVLEGLSRMRAAQRALNERQDAMLWKDGVRALVMELCCALHNFRVHLTPWQPMV